MTCALDGLDIDEMAQELVKEYNLDELDLNEQVQNLAHLEGIDLGGLFQTLDNLLIHWGCFDEVPEIVVEEWDRVSMKIFLKNLREEEDEEEPLVTLDWDF